MWNGAHGVKSYVIIKKEFIEPTGSIETFWDGTQKVFLMVGTLRSGNLPPYRAYCNGTESLENTIFKKVHFWVKKRH